MALHAKLQLSARRWRAPLWPVVLPLCDWLIGQGGVETSSFSLSFVPSLLLPLPAFPRSLLLCRAVWHLDQAARRSLFLSVWRNGSNFSCAVRHFSQSTSVHHQCLSGLQLAEGERRFSFGPSFYICQIFPRLCHLLFWVSSDKASKSFQNVFFFFCFWGIFFHLLQLSLSPHVHFSSTDQLHLSHVELQHTHARTNKPA